jgi:hypothetical protein
LAVLTGVLSAEQGSDPASIGKLEAGWRSLDRQASRPESPDGVLDLGAREAQLIREHLSWYDGLRPVPEGEHYPPGLIHAPAECGYPGEDAGGRRK